MHIFLTTALTIMLYLFVIGAVIKAYITLPRQLREMEKRIKKLERKEDKE